MISAENIWPALLEIYEQEKGPTGGGTQPRAWRLTRALDGHWRSESSNEPLEWSVRKDMITCDLSSPIPRSVAIEIGFFARYLELLWRQHRHSERNSESSPRLYTTACFAQSLDGFIATSTGDSQWIGNNENLLHAHRMRALHDAILVGCHTYMHDKPRLTVRHVQGEDPFRVVVTRKGELPDAFLAAITQPTLVIRPGTGAVMESDEEGLQLVTAQACVDGRYVCPKAIMKILKDLGLRSLLIEGGGVTVSLFKQHGLLDQADIQIAPLFLGAGIRPLTVDAASSIADAEFHTASVSALGDQSLMSLHFT